MKHFALLVFGVTLGTIVGWSQVGAAEPESGGSAGSKSSVNSRDGNPTDPFPRDAEVPGSRALGAGDAPPVGAARDDMVPPEGGFKPDDPSVTRGMKSGTGPGESGVVP